jgi:hypothetical protein
MRSKVPELEPEDSEQKNGTWLHMMVRFAHRWTLETKELKKAWNAFRFATTARKLGNEEKLFLMGEAVECEGLHHEKFDVADLLYLVG